MPTVVARQALTNTPFARLQIQPRAIRSYYYAGVVGDDTRIDDVKPRLHTLGFHPRGFKKGRYSFAKNSSPELQLEADLLWRPPRRS
jgi:hypothetical protein